MQQDRRVTKLQDCVTMCNECDVLCCVFFHTKTGLLCWWASAGLPGKRDRGLVESRTPRFSLYFMILLQAASRKCGCFRWVPLVDLDATSFWRWLQTL